MSQPYSTLKETVIERAFPEGIARNLRPLYEKRVNDGLIEAQRWIDYLKKRQNTLFPYNSTYYRQGTTIIAKPAGKVKRLFVFSSKTLKDIVYYDPCTREDIDRLVAQRSRSVSYPDLVPVTFGTFLSDSSMDKGYRSERGMFCIDKDEIILLPHIESSERICVEWSGSKTTFADDDIIDYGKYDAQVEELLENYLRMKALGKEDRSTTDYVMLNNEYKLSVAGLQIDTKEDTEPELTLEDLGVLPRQWMPTPPIISSLGCNYNPANAFFGTLWVLCPQNKLYYNLQALIEDGNPVTAVEGNGLVGGKPEVTYETIRCAQLNLNADDGNYYRLNVHVQDGQAANGFDAGIVDTAHQTICNNLATINVDILSNDDNQYYRLTLFLVDGVVAINMQLAPIEPENDIPVPAVCGAGNVFIIKDVVTQQCVYVRIKDGQFSISNE